MYELYLGKHAPVQRNACNAFENLAAFTEGLKFSMGQILYRFIASLSAAEAPLEVTGHLHLAI